MYGMPQPTIHFERSEKDCMLVDMGLKYMHDIATKLGCYLKGVEPMEMPRGSSQHFMGTTRIGKTEEDSTCDVNSLVWGCNNLYVGGDGNIPTETTCDPTLISSALAIKSVKSIMKRNLVK
jgi:pyranose oxidase